MYSPLILRNIRRRFGFILLPSFLYLLLIKRPHLLMQMHREEQDHSKSKSGVNPGEILMNSAKIEKLECKALEKCLKNCRNNSKTVFFVEKMSNF